MFTLSPEGSRPLFSLGGTAILGCALLALHDNCGEPSDERPTRCASPPAPSPSGSPIGKLSLVFRLLIL